MFVSVTWLSPIYITKPYIMKIVLPGMSFTSTTLYVSFIEFSHSPLRISSDTLASDDTAHGFILSSVERSVV